MKHYLTLSVTFLVMINVALGAVGDVGVSDAATTLQPEQSPSAGEYTNSYKNYESGLSSQAAFNQPSLSYPAPQISGPMQEQLTAEELGLSLPQMESFAPDESLGFVSASLPGNTHVVSTPVQSPIQATMPGSSIWYYPSSVVSANRFFIQTASGLKTVGGCSFQGYLPLWADIKSSGNFFVYEWYPGQSTPSVRWWGWTGTGWKKGWFSGDVPGWHILCYNSGIWSNYIYIYVYPKGAAISAPSGYSNAAASMTASLPLDAPIPPNPGDERIVLPDFNLYRPITDQSSQSSYNYPSLMSNSDQASYPGASSLPGLASSSRKTCTTCTSSTVIAGGVSSSYPYAKSCPSCTTPASQSAPYGYAAQSYQAVYPLPSVCKCNEYFVQSRPGKLGTVAGLFCEEWLPLWSKDKPTGCILVF